MSGRIRSIKPELNEDEKTASLDDHSWRLFVGLLVLADDYGNMRGSAEWLHGQVFWRFPEKILDTRESLARLTRDRLVTLYRVGDQTYLAITNWTRHQRVDKPGKPRVPGPEQGKNIDENEYSRESRDSLATSQEIPAPRARAQDFDPDHGINDHGKGSAEGDGADALPAAPASESSDSEPVQAELGLPGAGPKTGGSRAADETAEQVLEVFRHWARTCWSQSSDRDPKLTDERRRIIRARLKSYTVKDLLEALTRASKSDYHCKCANQDGKFYGDIDNLIGSDGKVDKWLASSEPQPCKPPKRSDGLDDIVGLL